MKITYLVMFFIFGASLQIHAQELMVFPPLIFNYQQACAESVAYLRSGDFFKYLKRDKKKPNAYLYKGKPIEFFPDKTSVTIDLRVAPCEGLKSFAKITRESLEQSRLELRWQDATASKQVLLGKQCSVRKANFTELRDEVSISCILETSGVPLNSTLTIDLIQGEESLYHGSRDLLPASGTH